MARELDRLPNLVNAGVTKAGTTSLFGYLAQHPDICPADGKDINYYSPMRFGDLPVQSLEAYAARFSHCTGEAYRLDSSPDYFTGGRPLVERMDRELPGVRVVVVLRDPVARLQSAYAYKRARGALPADVTFRDLLEGDLEARRSGADRTRAGQHHRAFSSGFYVEHLRAWFDVLGQARVRVVFFEHLAADARGEMKALMAWLGIDPGPVEAMELGVRNPTVQPRSHALRRLAEWVNVRADGVFQRAPTLESQLRSMYARVNGRRRRERFSPEEARLVADLYEEANHELAQLLAAVGYSSLPDWLVGDSARR